MRMSIEMRVNSVLIIGGGPAGLRAAEVANAAGAHVIVCEAQRSVGRKFLVAGRGGLNLTHGEPVENFPARYVDEPERWRDLLREFGPDDLRAWAAELGVETYVGTSGRVFPRGQKAAGLLRAWLRRLRASGVQFRTGSRFVGLTREAESWRAEFEPQGAAASNRKKRGVVNLSLKTPDNKSSLTAHAIVLALGGASWPETGSDGTWPAILAAHGVEIAPWQPANCGWEVDWPAELLGARGRTAAEKSHRARRPRIGLRRIADHAPRARGRRDLSSGPHASLNENAAVWRSISNRNSRWKRCVNE